MLIDDSRPTPTNLRLVLLLNRTLQVRTLTAQVSVARREHDIQLQLPSRGASRSLMWLHARRKLALIKGRKVDDEIVLDGEDGVGLEPGVVFGVDLGDTGLVSVLGDPQVDVGGTHRVAIERGEELPGWAVLREGVGGGSQAVESVFAVLVRLELSAEVVVGLVVGILEVVFAVAGGLPHVKGGVRDGLVGLHVADDAVHVGDDAVLGLVLDDGVSELSPRGVGGPEGTEDSGRRGDVVRVVDLNVVGDFGDEARRRNVSIVEALAVRI